MTVAIGVDIGGTKIAAGVVDTDGQILRREELPADLGDPSSVTRDLKILTEALRAGGDIEPVGLGIGAAGIVDHGTGHYFFGPNTGLRDCDLGPLASEAVGLPVLLDNDANCAAWAEHRYGVGQGCDDFICVTLGTGIGGGLVLGGRPYRGAHGGAGEIGHMVICEGGIDCPCGNKGCWERYASGLALQRMGRKIYGDNYTPRDITRMAREGDVHSIEIVDTLGRWIGRGLANLCNVLEPKRIAIAGGLSREWDLLETPCMEALVERYEAADRRPVPEVVLAKMGADAGMVGAAALMFDVAS